MTVLQLGYELDDQVPQKREDLLWIMRSQAAQDLDCLYLDIVVGVLHAVEEHEQVLIP